jgi:hypothetical protein
MFVLHGGIINVGTFCARASFPLPLVGLLMTGFALAMNLL